MRAGLRTELQRIKQRVAPREAEPLGYLSPSVFARDRLHFEPDGWQEEVLEWQGNRLLLNCCRQSGKSTITAILALHRALYNPRSLILLVSPSLRQSSELFRKVGDFLTVLPVRPALLEDNKLSLQLRNGSRIVSLPSKEETVRGFSGVSLLIEDESARVTDDLFYSLRPMLAVSNGRHILMSTPWGRRGHFHTLWETGGPDWQRVKIVASQCPRISAAFLDEEQRTMPAQVFASEYLCEFTDNEMNVFRYEDVMAALDNDLQPLWPIEDDFHTMLRRQQEGRAV